MKLTLTDELWALIVKTQWDCNNSTTYKSDKENHGLLEYWVGDQHLKVGDCEDYALKKMKILQKEGIPEECMGVATCFVNGEYSRGHAILLVSTDKGDYVLDNRFDEVLPWNEMPEYYKWNYIPPNIRD
jgi:predicted transglutaminase-like cysteine proteinase